MQYGIFRMRWVTASRGSVSGSGDSCLHLCHPPMRLVLRSLLSVCLSVLFVNFWKPWPRNSIFGKQVKFVYQVHRVKVKSLRKARINVTKYTHSRAVCHSAFHSCCGMRLDWQMRWQIRQSMGQIQCFITHVTTDGGCMRNKTLKLFQNYSSVLFHT